jgi:uncharacterized membrane protein YdjX (TVP38/TMEM64 family)
MNGLVWSFVVSFVVAFVGMVMMGAVVFFVVRKQLRKEFKR